MKVAIKCYKNLWYSIDWERRKRSGDEKQEMDTAISGGHSDTNSGDLYGVCDAAPNMGGIHIDCTDYGHRGGDGERRADIYDECRDGGNQRGMSDIRDVYIDQYRADDVGGAFYIRLCIHDYHRSATGGD